MKMTMEKAYEIIGAIQDRSEHRTYVAHLLIDAMSAGNLPYDAYKSADDAIIDDAKADSAVYDAVEHWIRLHRPCVKGSMSRKSGYTVPPLTEAEKALIISAYDRLYSC